MSSWTAASSLLTRGLWDEKFKMVMKYFVVLDQEGCCNGDILKAKRFPEVGLFSFPDRCDTCIEGVCCIVAAALLLELQQCLIPPVCHKISFLFAASGNQ